MKCYCCKKDKETHSIEVVKDMAIDVCEDCLPIVYASTKRILAHIQTINKLRLLQMRRVVRNA